MGPLTKVELVRENRQLRDALEEIYDEIADVLGIEEEDEGEDGGRDERD